MKFILKGPFKENIYNLIRIIGYHFQDEDKGKKELVFTRPAKGYPRFHIYSIWGKMVSTLFFFKLCPWGKMVGKNGVNSIFL